MNSVFPCALTPAALHLIARQYITERYPAQLALFHARFTSPPANPDEAHELGFVCGLLLGLDLAAQLHTPGSSPDTTAVASPAAAQLFQLAH